MLKKWWKEAWSEGPKFDVLTLILGMIISFYIIISIMISWVI